MGIHDLAAEAARRQREARAALDDVQRQKREAALLPPRNTAFDVETLRRVREAYSGAGKQPR